VTGVQTCALPILLTKTENILAEIDTYTSYCALVDMQIDKAREYVSQNAALVASQALAAVAAFPYGVGPAIMAVKIQAAQVILAAENVQEQIEVPLAIADKLLELASELPGGVPTCEPNILPIL
jgi:hypothetical protein